MGAMLFTFSTITWLSFHFYFCSFRKSTRFLSKATANNCTNVKVGLLCPTLKKFRILKNRFSSLHSRRSGVFGQSTLLPGLRLLRPEHEQLQRIRNLSGQPDRKCQLKSIIRILDLRIEKQLLRYLFVIGI